MKRSFYSAVITVSAVLVLQSCSGNNNTQSTAEKAKPDTLGVKFLKTALERGLTEIKVSELAAGHAKNPRVAELAKMVISDHTKADGTIKKLEQQDAVTDDGSINPADNQSIDSLSKKSGDEFDKAYIKAMIKDHESAVLLFVHATQATDSTTRIFAKKALPIIQMHLDSARKINKDLK